MADDAKLSRFIDAVNEDIDSKVAVIINGAETERDSILSDAKTQAEEQASKLYETNCKRITQKITRQVSQNEFTAKKEILKHREELTEQLFKEVEDKLKEIRRSKDYIDILSKKLAMVNIESGSEIALAPEDMHFSEVLKIAVDTDNITFVPDSMIRFGGYSIYNKHNGTIIDKTFDGAIDEQRVLFTNRNIFA
ncbi:MAG: V-type proton ATPase subunit E [Ruminococcus sp.]|jgi:vacuolar-type H+-ATPase subunit E/Vma4|nr:V-type proton ATPase subunit E [Ruminococcus sp.]